MTQTITVKMYKDSGYYFVDATEVDQGAAGSGLSVKDIVDAIGTSKSATMVFGHTGTGNTTTYAFSTSEVIPSNIEVLVEEGAVISIATGVTITIGNFIDPGLSQVFSCTGTGTPVFSVGAVDWVYSEWFGALAESAGGGTADQAYINQAIVAAQNTKKVRLVAGYYDIASDILASYDDMILEGAGRTNTFLYISIANVASFTNGVIDMSGCSEPGIQIRDLCIKFEQTDSSSKGDITVYKPAIYAVGVPRFKINRARISLAYDGIDMTGNCGGTVIDDLELSCFNLGIEIDGALDEVFISHLRLWPFDMTANQDDIFFTLASVTGINVKRCDGLAITNSMFICGTGIDFDSGGAADSFTRVDNTNFDSYSQIEVDSNHIVLFNNCWFSKAANGFKCLDITDGNVHVSNSYFNIATSNQTVILYTGSDAAVQSTLTVTGCIFRTGAVDVTSIYCNENGAGVLLAHIHGNHFVRTTNTAYANPAIKFVNNVRGSIIGNSTVDKGTGSGEFMNIDTDDYLTVVGNAGVDMAINIPAPTNLQHSSNVPTAA